MAIIEIKRDGRDVQVRLDPKLWQLDERVLVAVNTRNSALDAQLFVSRMQEVLAEEIRVVRRVAYLDGYRDGRGKRARQDWFSGEF